MVQGLSDCCQKWEPMTDTFRKLHPDAKEYTHRQNIGGIPGRKAYTTYRRIDRIYVTDYMILFIKGEGTPKVTEANIINPTHTDLLALKRTGLSSKWSDQMEQ